MDKYLQMAAGAMITFFVIMVLWIAYDTGYSQGGVDVAEGRIECRKGAWGFNRCELPIRKEKSS